jgi:phage tail sheath protein FI
MARLNYSAPGVYVEEVPSARQPIIGVGTNTVGFIGIVPDTIYRPVANPAYDPVSARAMLALQRSAAAAAGGTGTGPTDGAVADATREIAARLAARKSDLEALVESLAKSDARIATLTQARDDAKRDRDGLPATAGDTERNAADRKVTNAENALQRAGVERARIDGEREQAQTDIDALQAGPAVAPAPATPAEAAPAPEASAEHEASYEDIYTSTNPPPRELLQPSLLRPYYLVPFKVTADEFDTKLCTNFTEYANRFGDFSAFGSRPAAAGDGGAAPAFEPLHPGHHHLTHAVNGFFKNGGTRCFVARVRSEDGLPKALQRFESIDDVAILAAPGLPKSFDVWSQLEDYCEDAAHQNVFAILDSPDVVNDGGSDELDVLKLQYDSADNLLPRMSSHAAFYFPFIEVGDPAKRIQDEDPARDVAPKYRGLTHVAPSGHIAGVYARTDEERGVHKAPANAIVRGALEVKYYVSKPKQELLNPQGVNCLRIMNGAVVVWGARTMGGERNGEWKYVNVRRFAGFLEESIDEGTQWVVFEPNDPSLWSKIRLNVTAFLTNVWRNGALFGQTAEEAFYVKCDAELNPPEVRDLGQVITEIGVAIVRPAEFVIFRISQSADTRRG